MRKSIIFSITCIIYVFSCISSYSQEKEPIVIMQKKNTVNITAGYLLLGGAIYGGYERIVGESNHRFFTSYWLGVAMGKYALWDEVSRFLMVDIKALTGSVNNHMEISAGFGTFKDIWSYEHREPGDPSYFWRYYAPVGSIGYRFQKPDGMLIFRTGVGFPEGIYISTGLRF